MTIGNPEKHQIVLDKLSSLIESDSSVTITLGKLDLMMLHSAIFDEKLYYDKYVKLFNSKKDSDDYKETLDEINEIRLDSISDMEGFLSHIIQKIS